MKTSVDVKAPPLEPHLQVALGGLGMTKGVFRRRKLGTTKGTVPRRKLETTKGAEYVILKGAQRPRDLELSFLTPHLQVPRWALETTLVALLALTWLRTASAQTWVPQQSGTTAELRGLSAVSDNVVWASGQRGTVLHTTDGGAHWILDTIPGASKLDLRAIEGTSDRVAHAMSIGDSSRIFRTLDGGKTWTQQFISLKKGSFFDAIRFWDAKHGIAMSDPVDGKFLIVTTDDGGDTWKETPSAGMPAALPNEGAFAASGSCLAVFGERDAWFVTGGASVARVFHSSDRGQTWNVNETPIRAGVAAAGIFSAAFISPLRGAISGGNYEQARIGGRNLAFTNDGGRSWTLADSAAGPQGYRSQVTFVPKTNGQTIVAVGLSGSDISRDGGKTWTSFDATALNSLVLIAEGAGYAVGPRGRIMRLGKP